jgi:hypothetical protein
MNQWDKDKVIRAYTYELEHKTFSPEELVRNIINEVEVAEKMEWEERTKYDAKFFIGAGALIVLLAVCFLEIWKVI